MKISDFKYVVLFGVFFLTTQNIAGLFEFIQLETEHLILRKVEMDDVQDIAKLVFDQRVIQLTGLFPEMSSIEQVQNYVDKFLVGDEILGRMPLYPMSWSIVHKESKKVVGLVCFSAYSQRHQRAELAYALLPDYWNCGYTTQACKAVVQYALDQGLCRIYATVDPENIASERVLLKLGMLYEGLLRSYLVVGGERKDRKMYAIVK